MKYFYCLILLHYNSKQQSILTLDPLPLCGNDMIIKIIYIVASKSFEMVLFNKYFFCCF